MRTLEEINARQKELVTEKDRLIKEYRETHYIPSRGRIITPEILKIEAEEKELFREYLEARKISK